MWRLWIAAAVVALAGTQPALASFELTGQVAEKPKDQQQKAEAKCEKCKSQPCTCDVSRKKKHAAFFKKFSKLSPEEKAQFRQKFHRARRHSMFMGQPFDKAGMKKRGPRCPECRRHFSMKHRHGSMKHRHFSMKHRHGGFSRHAMARHRGHDKFARRPGHHRWHGMQKHWSQGGSRRSWSPQQYEAKLARIERQLAKLAEQVEQLTREMQQK